VERFRSNKTISKALANLVSVKATVFVMACIFLWKAKITESSWVQVVGIVIGARTANELLAIARNKNE